eukprot:gene13158-13262_t
MKPLVFDVRHQRLSTLSIFRKLLSTLCGAGILAAAIVANIQPAAAVPSFARQTGQPCAACHTAFPELTPFGRRFKLGGYTLEGGDSKLPAFSVMDQATFTNYAKGLDAPAGTTYGPPAPNGGFKTNNNVDLTQQTSLFYAGKVYGNLGAFVQTTFANGYTRNVSLDLTDIRYADSVKLGGSDVVYGLTLNNAPGVQDVWNTTPQWNFPYIKSIFSLSPAASTLIEGFGSSQTAGAGAYIFAHDLVYAELSAYGTLPPRTQTTLGVSPPDPTNTIKGLAPYWRLAIEPNWGEHSLMIGTFGMYTNIAPGRIYGIGTDKIADIGFDSQYQWIGDMHAITARASYIHESQKLDASSAFSGTNAKNHLNSFRSSVSYIYDHTISITGGYFSITGSPDAAVYGNNVNNSPNSAGYIFDVAYLPFSHGAPGPWPWINTRIGVSYTGYTKFDGGSSNIDGLGRRARDNNTTMLYASFLAVIAPELAHELMLDPQALANMQACWIGGFVVMQFPVGWALDMIGPRRSVASLMLVAVIGAFLFARAHSATELNIAMALIGIGCSAIFMGALYIFGRMYPPHQFALFCSSLLGIGSAGNLLAASPMAWAAATIGWRGAMLAIAGATAVSTLSVLILIRDPERMATREQAGFFSGIKSILFIRAIWPLLPLTLVSYSIILAERGLWAGPFFSNVYGLNALGRGYALLVMATAMSAGALLYGPLDRVFGTHKWVIVSGSAATTICFLVLGLADLSLVQSIVAMALLGAFGMTYGVLMGHSRSFFPHHLLGRGITLMNIMFIGGAGLMQPISGAIMQSMSTIPPAVAFGRLHLGFGLILLAALGTMDETLPVIIGLLAVAIVVAIAARQLKLPYTVGLVIVGIGVAVLKPDFGLPLTHDLIFELILPPLLFEAAINISWPHLRQDLGPVLVLSTLGTLIAAAAITAGMVGVLAWPLPSALVFGVLISATDPVAIIAMFKDNHLEGRLRLLVESESLLNDGVAAVLFVMALSWAMAPSDVPTLWQGLVSFAWIACGGMCIGAVCAGISALVAGRTSEHLVEAAVTSVAAYGSFFIAEKIHVSGVLATVTAGILLGNIGFMRGNGQDFLTVRGREFVLSFWDFAAFLANSIVFLLIGVNLAKMQFQMHSVFLISISILIGLIGRGLTVYPLCLLFFRTSRAIPFTMQHILWWGGLRGALALALSLSLPVTLPFHDEIIVVTFGTVAFSVVVQGLTMPAEEWGSISVEFKDDNMSNPAYGIGGGKTKEEAETNAQKFCESKSCKTVISYQKCGAYAASAKHGGYGMSSTKKAAEDLAINACGSDACKVIVADCN